MAQEIRRQRYNFSVSDDKPETCRAKCRCALRERGIVVNLKIEKMKNNQEIKELFDSMALSKQKSKLIIGGGGNTGGGGIIPNPPGAFICLFKDCNQACNTSCTNCVSTCPASCQATNCSTKGTLWG